jgi:hypothetical protein
MAASRPTKHAAAPPASLLLALVCLAAHFISCQAITVSVRNNCRYSVMVAITFFSADTSTCDYTSTCDGCTPVCINHWYTVRGGETSALLSGIENTCLYFTAYMIIDPSTYWPAEPNCRYCLHTLDYLDCTGSKSEGCYTWFNNAVSDGVVRTAQSPALCCGSRR